MPNLTESDIEEFAIELFRALGWDYVYGPDIVPNGTTLTPALSQREREKEGERGEVGRYSRESFDEVVLVEELSRAVDRLNPDVPEEIKSQAIKEVSAISSPALLANNETFHRMLIDELLS